MKLTFQDIYRNIFDVQVAEIAIRKWLSWAVRSRLEPIKKFAKMIKSHYTGVLPRIDSGFIASHYINSFVKLLYDMEFIKSNRSIWKIFLCT